MAIRRTLSTVLFAVAASSLLVLTGCSSDDSSSASTSGANKSTSSQDSQSTQDLAVSEQWVKAAKSGMTSAFGTIMNTGEKDIRIVSASSDVAESTELHEVVDGKMQEKKDGFVVPADGELKLTPGGAHLMLMGLKKPITAGQNVVITLRLADGSTQTIDALARDFEGNQEDYEK